MVTVTKVDHHGYYAIDKDNGKWCWANVDFFKPDRFDIYGKKVNWGE